MIGSESASLVAPKCAEHEDRKLVESAISRIRTLLRETVTRGMEEIGRYLLQTFYNDDPQLFFSGNPKKHVSLRLLLKRCETMELPVTRTFLANALRIAVISRGLPRAAKFHELPSTHRLQLLRIKDPESVELLASKAVSEKLTVPKLRSLVDNELAQQGTVSPRGRRRAPRVLRAIGPCLQSLQDEQTGKLLVSRSDIRDMTEQERARARAWLVALQRSLTKLRRLIR